MLVRFSYHGISRKLHTKETKPGVREFRVTIKLQETLLHAPKLRAEEISKRASLFPKTKRVFKHIEWAIFKVSKWTVTVYSLKVCMWTMSCNSVTFPYFTFWYLPEGQQSVGSLLWRKNISMHYMFSLSECNIDQFYVKHHFLSNCTAMFTSRDLKFC